MHYSAVPKVSPHSSSTHMPPPVGTGTGHKHNNKSNNNNKNSSTTPKKNNAKGKGGKQGKCSNDVILCFSGSAFGVSRLLVSVGNFAQNTCSLICAVFTCNLFLLH